MLSLSRIRSAAKLLAATAMVTAVAAFGAVGVASPAAADENGSEFCYLSTGTVTATPVTQPLTYGGQVVVRWNVIPQCPDLAVFVSGPGFAPGEVLLAGGSRTVRAIVDGPTATWSLSALGMDSSMPQLLQLASVTVAVQ